MLGADQPVVGPAGVVHQHVKPAEFGHCRGHSPFAVGEDRDVTRYDQTAPAQAPHQLGGGVELVLRAGGDADVCPGGREDLGEQDAEAV